MIKAVTLIHRNPSLSPAEFREYWENTHAPLVKRLLPGLCLYTGGFPVEDDGTTRPGEEFACDAIVELGWPDKETMNRDMNSPQFNTPERKASSARLMDLSRLRTVLLEEVVIDVS